MAYLDAYSTEQLTKDLKSPWPGVANAAPYLLELDTPERRARASAEAHTLQNIRGCIFSQGVADAVSALKRAIADGKEGEELYGEAFARQERERQQALRKQRDHHLRNERRLH